jgi:hypothetical protein
MQDLWWRDCAHGAGDGSDCVDADNFRSLEHSVPRLSRNALDARDRRSVIGRLARNLLCARPPCVVWARLPWQLRQRDPDAGDALR